MGKLILVADDSKTARHYLCSVLEREGYKTIQAENGLEVIGKIKVTPPDLVILDLLMPEMDGLDVLRELKGIKLNIPIVILTADIQDEVREECFSLGATGFVNKPFKENELLETLKKLI